MYVKIIVSCVIVLALSSLTVAQYEDVRCKCICEGRQLGNKTEGIRLLIKSVDFDQCTCDQVVDRSQCPQCQCRYESRKTQVIKGVVIFIMVVVGGLVIYMIFLQALEPFLNKRRLRYQAMSRGGIEDIQPLTRSDPVIPPVRPRSISDPVSQVMTKAKTQREKWKDNVEVQRTHVYDHHRLLN